MKTLNKISEYYGIGDYNGLRSTVEECNGIYSVAFYKDNRFTKDLVFPTKSLRYVEDVAENYVLGIMILERDNND
jgi:hypothetical protein